MTNVKQQDYAISLKHETKVAHLETEHILVQRLKKIQKKEDYAAILKMFYGYFAPLEKLVDNYIGKHLLQDIDERRKASRLQNDLVALGVTNKPDICAELPTIQNSSHAFGALYVLEGSTLGGEIIVKMLKANPALQIQDAALSFFYGYGENNKLMWQRFQKALHQHIGDSNKLLEVTMAANETFRCLKNWMLNHHHATNPY